MLEIDHNLSNTIKHLFLDYQWYPEEIEGRLRLEYGKAVISYQTIYRAIYRGHFDNRLSHGARGVLRKLRHRGKTRHTKGYVEKEGEFLFLIPFTKNPKNQTSELGSVIGKQIRLQVKLEKLA